MPNNTEKISCKACRVVLPAYKRYVAYALTGAIAAFFIGFYFGQTIQKSDELIAPEATFQEDSYEEGYLAALEFARDRLKDKGLFSDDPSNSLAGTIQSIADKEIVLQFEASELDILQDGLTTKTISINENVLIEKEVDKPDEQYEKEYTEYRKAREAHDAFIERVSGEEPEPPEPPQSFTIQSLSFVDLKVGDKVEVFSDIDIRTSDKIEVIRILFVNRSPENPEEPVEEPVEEELPEEPTTE